MEAKGFSMFGPTPCTKIEGVDQEDITGQFNCHFQNDLHRAIYEADLMQVLHLSVDGAGVLMTMPLNCRCGLGAENMVISYQDRIKN